MSPESAGQCARCGKEFVDRTRPQNRRFCSDRCRRDNYASSEKARGRCIDCGDLLGFRGGRGPANNRLFLRCGSCEVAVRNAARQGRRGAIAAMWSEGASSPEIAQRLGSTSNSIGSEIARMRADGWDVALRRPDRVEPTRELGRAT